MRGFVAESFVVAEAGVTKEIKPTAQPKNKNKKPTGFVPVGFSCLKRAGTFKNGGTINQGCTLWNVCFCSRKSVLQ